MEQDIGRDTGIYEVQGSGPQHRGALSNLHPVSYFCHGECFKVTVDKFSCITPRVQ